jgi:hypothetical protein
LDCAPNLEFTAKSNTPMTAHKAKTPRLEPRLHDNMWPPRSQSAKHANVPEQLRG